MRPRNLLLPLSLALAAPALAQPITNAFTYQGALANNGQPAAGIFDVEFRLYDALTAGAQVGPTLCTDNLAVTDGRFTVQLDFGAQFATQSRFVEVRVRQDTGLHCSSPLSYTTLSPRQPITAAPAASFSLTSATATTATNATNLNNQPASFYTNAVNLTGTLPDARLSTNVPRLNTANTFTAIPAFNGGATGASPPFTVDSGALVANLNADLLDGLSASSFATASHTHDAGAILTGTINEARLSSNIARLNLGQSFTGQNSFSNDTTFTDTINIAYGARTLQIRNDDGLVPALNLTGTAGNLGILRLRNKLEVWPNDAGTALGSIDIRNFVGDANITLSGSGTGTFSGDVGVGTSSPTQRLDVRGSIAMGPAGDLFAPASHENLRIIRGFVFDSGERQPAYTGFTSSLQAGPLYSVTFDTPFSAPPTVVVSLYGSTADGSISASFVTATGFEVNTRDRAGVRALRGFMFTAIGPR